MEKFICLIWMACCGILPAVVSVSSRRLTDVRPSIGRKHFPSSNHEAQVRYCDPDFEGVDKSGQPRAALDEHLWSSVFEVVPEHIFGGEEKLRQNIEEEDIVEGAAVGGEIIQLGEPLGATTFSKVFGLAGETKQKWAIKYHVYCSSGYLTDPVLREAYFLDLLRETAITTEILYFSKALSRNTLFTMRSPKWNPSVLEQLSECHNRLSIRYLIVERVGESIHRYMQGQRPHPRIAFHEVLNITIATMLLLKKAHELNVVHGDIHLGNIAWSLKHLSDRRNFADLVLIDFGRARIVGPDDTPLSQLKMSQHREQSNIIINCHELYSQWEIFNYPSSFRDDVYRVMLMMAVMAYGSGYMTTLGKTCLMDTDQDGVWRLVHPTAMIHAKASASNLLDVDMLLPNGQAKSYSLVHLLPGYTQVSTGLDSIMAHIRKLAFTEKPNHDYIIDQLRLMKAGFE